jgi:hypothetical protein
VSDYVLTVASNPGVFATGFVESSGAVPIADYGDVIVRVRPAPPAIPGDYDRNGSVGPGDYNLWRSTYGSAATLNADGNQNGRVDAADYVVWRKALGPGSGVSTFAAMTAPEPNSCLLVGLTVTPLVARRGRRRRVA